MTGERFAEETRNITPGSPVLPRSGSRVVKSHQQKETGRDCGKDSQGTMDHLLLFDCREG